MIETNFKHTDLGLIPHDWDVKAIESFTDVVTGATPSTIISDYWGGKIRWMSSGELNDKFIYDVKGRISELGYANSGTHMLPTHCVLIGLAGQGKTRGTAAYNFVELCTNQSIGAILPQQTFNSLYLYYYIDSIYSYLRMLSSGEGGRGGLNKKILLQLPIPLPPTIIEQERIAGALSSIDTLIGALTEQIEKKRHIKQGTMQQLLTGKKRLAGFTGEWKEVRLGDYCAITTGHKDVNIAVANGQYNFYTCSRDVYKANTYSFDTEAILIAGNGDVGNLHYHKGKFEVYQRTYVLHEFKADVQYILHNLAWNLITHLKQGIIGSTIPYIVIGQLLDYPLALPPTIAEQSAIAAVLSGMDTGIAALEQKRDKYIAIKSGMMQNLLTGKIRLV